MTKASKRKFSISDRMLLGKIFDSVKENKTGPLMEGAGYGEAYPNRKTQMDAPNCTTNTIFNVRHCRNGRKLGILGFGNIHLMSTTLHLNNPL